MHTRGWYAANANANGLANGVGNGRGGGGGGTNNGISYHGGPVLQAGTNVVAVYWSPTTVYNGGPTPGTFAIGSNSGDGSVVGDFLRGLGGSNYFAINTTYTDGSGKAIKNVVTYTGYWANASAPTASPTDADMLAMLQSGFNSNPAALSYDSQTLYLIMTAGTTNLGGGFGTQYCAYHYHGTVNVGGVNRTVLYAAMPYTYAKAANCTWGPAPNGDPGADSEVNVLAHEIEETTTDMMGTAWFDNRGYENADKCAWTWGTISGSGINQYNVSFGGRNYFIQQNWVNANGGGCKQSWP